VRTVTDAFATAGGGGGGGMVELLPPQAVRARRRIEKIRQASVFMALHSNKFAARLDIA